MTDVQREFIEKLYNDLRAGLITFAATYFGNPAPVDDAVQELYMRACENVEILMKHETPNRWMFATLRNIMRDIYKEHSRDKNLYEKVQQASLLKHGKVPSHIDEENPDILYSNLIDRSDYRLFRKMADEGYSLAQLAKEEGISVEACKKRLQRARKALKKYFEKS